jgi:asparagine synthase (glutamine-hydrolysing)
MCGIAGLYNLDGAPVDVRVLRGMTDAVRHRGPDDQGFSLFSLHAPRAVAWTEANPPATTGLEGGLGFNRLSILDLSREGHQPMVSADGNAIIIYNGETYNAFDLRPDLEAAGYRFRSRSDTEVLLYLYQHYGIEGMLARINGMFAFCLVDLREGRLYLVRDRLGIKPLYWWSNGRTLLFSSEVKSFLHHPAFTPELDAARLDEHFLFRYDAGSGSLFKGVKQLDPGHWLSIENSAITTRPYWTVPDHDGAPPLDRRQAADRLEAHVSRSVRMQLLSDVKVGCQLSGGVDSSLVTMFAARQSPGSLDGFSVVFEDTRVSEEVWIDEAARVAGVEHHKYNLDDSSFSDSMEAATWHLDQPLNHPNSLGIFHLSKQARPHVTVFLSGEGADELFGGYTRFLYAKVRPTVAPLTPVLKWLPHIGDRVYRRFGAGLNGRVADDVSWFILQSAFLSPSELMALRPDADLKAVIEKRRAIFEDSSGDHVARCLKYELRTYLLDLLLRQDKMTMAHSMENRVPYLDHELVEFVRSLPTSRLVAGDATAWPMRMGNTKVVLKDVARRYFRSGFVYRSKMGFPLPLNDFLLSPSFRPVMEERLLPSLRRRSIVDAAAVNRWWESLLRGESTDVESLWICAAFELWMQLFLDGRGGRVQAA